MTNKQKNWEKKFNPRSFGKTTKMLAEFYALCRTRKEGIFVMSEGIVYTPEALKKLLKTQRKEIEKELKNVNVSKTFKQIRKRKQLKK